MKRLRALILALDNNEPLDWLKLQQLLIKQDVTPATLGQLFHERPVEAGGYLVEILDTANYKALIDRLGIWADMTDRASAAVHGKSHAVPVSGNLVVVKSPGSLQPVVFECDRNGDWIYPIHPGTELVLVENLENFLSREVLLPYLREACGAAVSEDRADIAYAAGNAITKACNAAWLASYETVYCFFDIDTGGFRMYEALRRLMAGHPVEMQFVAPKALSALLETTHRHLTDKERETLITYQHCDPPINLLANTLLKAGKSLEQEVYLND